VEVGFQLMVRPEIIPGTNRMTLEVIPKETSLSGTGDSTLAPPGFDVFQVGAAGAAGSIALPRVRSSTIVTSMMLESGQTAVIGGLSTDTELRTESRVPFISAVPLLGELFKHRENTVERRSLMVFITPTILRSAGDSDRILQAELERRADEYGQKLEEILYGPETEGTDLEAAPTSGGEDVELTTFVGGGS
ncbi:MAG: type II secretion system protein GspD, partial [Planctomycetota bacterium]